MSIESINLSIVAFMLSQGISPLFIGSATDITGRRPIYILCLTVYVAVSAGLYRLPKATDNNKHAVYAGLIVLRIVQASGSASMVSIGAVRYHSVLQGWDGMGWDGMCSYPIG